MNPLANRSDYYHGELATRDVYEVERQCFDRFGTVTCQSCRSGYLPSGGALYFG